MLKISHHIRSFVSSSSIFTFFNGNYSFIKMIAFFLKNLNSIYYTHFTLMITYFWHFLESFYRRWKHLFGISACVVVQQQFHNRHQLRTCRKIHDSSSSADRVMEQRKALTDVELITRQIIHLVNR